MAHKLSRLDNGIRVVSEKIRGVRSVSLGFWFPVGSRDESPELAGASHFLEHAIFKGTKKRPSIQVISSDLDDLGADVNAFTSKEYTFFYLKLLDEHVENGFEIMADLLQGPLMKKKDIDSERKVIIEEIMITEDTPDDKIHDLYVQNIWPGHSLGRPIFGSVDSVNALSNKKLAKFFDDHYLHEDLIISAAGNIDHDELKKLTSKYFDRVNVGTRTKEHTAPVFQSGLFLENRATEQAQICAGFKSFDHKHEDRFTLLVLNNILSGGMSSRLNQAVREKHGLAYTVYSFNHSYSDAGTFAVYAGTRPENLKKVWSLICKELDKMKKRPVTDIELRRNKEQIKAGSVFSAESTNRRMERLGRALIEDRKIIGMDELLNKIDAVDSAKVMELANRLFDMSMVSVTVLGPYKKKDLQDLI